MGYYHFESLEVISDLLVTKVELRQDRVTIISNMRFECDVVYLA